MADAKWQPAGPPTTGERATTASVSATVANLKNPAWQRAQRDARRGK
jgi:hypothetical protein